MKLVLKRDIPVAVLLTVCKATLGDVAFHASRLPEGTGKGEGQEQEPQH